VIYFVHAPALQVVKIGFTAGDPSRRLTMLRTGCPCDLVLLATMDGDETVERELHIRFAEYRSRGEWFYFCPPLRELVASLTPKEAKPKKLTQRDIAEKAGLSEPYVSQLLSGKRVHIPAILHLFKTTGVRAPHFADTDEHLLRELAEKVPYEGRA
jgi:hypothetical protein